MGNWKEELEAYARRTDPDTSHAAAASMGTERLSELQQKVVNALRALGGKGTAEEIVQMTGSEWQSITPRLRPLVRLGVIRDSGVRKKASAGRFQIVWELIK